MKVEFFFPREPIWGYVKNNGPDQVKVNAEIKEKVHNKVVEIPCVPSKEMRVDISSFAQIFGFTKEELEWIDDGNDYFYITNILIKPGHLELFLERRISE